jgi:hypothetical protein
LKQQIEFWEDKENKDFSENAKLVQLKRCLTSANNKVENAKNDVKIASVHPDDVQAVIDRMF